MLHSHVNLSRGGARDLSLAFQNFDSRFSGFSLFLCHFLSIFGFVLVDDPGDHRDIDSGGSH